MVGSTLGVYSFGLIFFSARTNKGHHHTNEISAKPGQQAELVWTFKKPGQYAMACFEPGHYEAGMKGVINVVARKH
jgi:uncharacterized cupredoxin-like copper-binding protein